MRENKTLYGISADYVQEILPMPVTTRIPMQPEYMSGLINYKGSVVPVVSLGRICGNDETAENICIIVSAGESTLGMAVEEVVRTREESTEKISYDEAAMNCGFLKVSDVLKDQEGAVFVLNIEQILEALTESQESAESPAG